MPELDRDSSNVNRTGINHQSDLPQHELNNEEKPEGVSRGRNVYESEDSKRLIEKETQGKIPVIEEKRDVTVAETAKSQKINAYIDKITDISKRSTLDVTSLIDIIRENRLLLATLSLALLITIALVVVCFAASIVLCVVIVVILNVVLKSLLDSHIDNKHATLSIIKDFATNLLEEYPEDNYQQALDRLEELTTSREFYQKVKMFRIELQNVSKHLSVDHNYEAAIKQTQELLTFMFDFIKQDLPEDKKTTFTKIKKQYLTKFLNNREIGKKFLDSISCINSTKEKQLNLLTATESEKPRSEFLQDAFYAGIEAYLHKDQETNLLL